MDLVVTSISRFVYSYVVYLRFLLFFFFQAEDGIRDTASVRAPPPVHTPLPPRRSARARSSTSRDSRNRRASPPASASAAAREWLLRSGRRYLARTPDSTTLAEQQEEVAFVS